MRLRGLGLWRQSTEGRLDRCRVSRQRCFCRKYDCTPSASLLFRDLVEMEFKGGGDLLYGVMEWYRE